MTMQVVCKISAVDEYRKKLDQELMVCSHPSNNSLVIFKIGDNEITVPSELVEQAVANATSVHGKYPVPYRRFREQDE